MSLLGVINTIPAIVPANATIFVRLSICETTNTYDYQQYLCHWPSVKLCFSPLVRFPESLLWRGFRLPMVKYTVQGELPYHLKDFHDHYGRVSSSQSGFE